MAGTVIGYYIKKLLAHLPQRKRGELDRIKQEKFHALLFTYLLLYSLRPKARRTSAEYAQKPNEVTEKIMFCSCLNGKYEI
jgi:hypothetical protein